ncbi:MAG: hypothetical protein JNM14_01880 [Ferruginibacter sp.]|nr:hypothetical protein [Ferruginibacter sp.]
MKKIILLLIVLTNISVIGFAQRLRPTRSVARPCAHATTNNGVNNGDRQYRASIAPKKDNETVKVMPDPSPTAKESKKPEESSLQSVETYMPKPDSESPKAVTDKPKQNQTKPQESGKPL